MQELQAQFKLRLEQIISGDLYKRCFQCGACVGDCPAARYAPEFNPRVIMQNTSLGLEGLLATSESLVWKCTNCYTCYERCPQDVRPIEVILAIKNLVAAAGALPRPVQDVVQAVRGTGRTVVISDTVNRRREKMGLPPLAPLPMSELRKLMEQPKPKREEVPSE